jgi:hypothetical protein
MSIGVVFSSFRLFMCFLSDFVACRWMLSANKIEGVVSLLAAPRGEKKGTETGCQKKAIVASVCGLFLHRTFLASQPKYMLLLTSVPKKQKDTPPF